MDTKGEARRDKDCEMRRDKPCDSRCANEFGTRRENDCEMRRETSLLRGKPCNGPPTR
jgi:hypothetical protein